MKRPPALPPTGQELEPRCSPQKIVVLKCCHLKFSEAAQHRCAAHGDHQWMEMRARARKNNNSSAGHILTHSILLQEALRQDEHPQAEWAPKCGKPLRRTQAEAQRCHWQRAWLATTSLQQRRGETIPTSELLSLGLEAIINARIAELNIAILMPITSIHDGRHRPVPGNIDYRAHPVKQPVHCPDEAESHGDRDTHARHNCGEKHEARARDRSGTQRAKHRQHDHRGDLAEAERHSFDGADEEDCSD
mmetsp:Transcript_101574/g.273171  ORF Transcript_101574/g.273171 Transcript_101574/m.273171 type:complete len:248 (+) Transcript_101574:199-942(+)